MEKVKNPIYFSLVALFCVLLAGFLSAEEKDSPLVLGYDAYMSGDWASATLFLRRAVSEKQNSTEEAWYMLIMSEVYAGQSASVVQDCDFFTENFPESNLKSYVSYQEGRAQYLLGQTDVAVLTLSDFCHQYPRNPLYGSALFYLGECFYDDYSYDMAGPLYERVISEYPNDSHVAEARLKLESIEHDEREQKLLYLLRMTGEEYLSSREGYERELKNYQTDDVESLYLQLQAANARIAELEAEQANAGKATGDTVRAEDVAALKQKALRVQELIDEQSESSTSGTSSSISSRR